MGEIPGTIHPEQVVLIGGHLDSWDPGTGWLDDVAGIAIAVNVAAWAAFLHIMVQSDVDLRPAPVAPAGKP